MTRARLTARLALALAIAFLLVYLTNLAPSYLGPLEPIIDQNQTLFVGMSLILVSLFWLWRSGYLRRIQSKGRVAAFEIVIAALLLVTLTAHFGLGVSPFNLCIGGGGGFTCYPDSRGFLGGLLNLMLIVLAEELFFRAYLMNELNQILGVGVGVVIASALLFSLFHLPALQIEGFGAISLLGFSQILVGAISLSACYWYTGRNLAAVLLLHAYWDGIGALLLLPTPGQYGPILLLLGQLSLPSAVLVITHKLWSRLS
ncbi:MAG TPA: CPBP family intramembrane glutamic endopeptidase [Nitrososphaerales archaeon]|nr:CPBP family intramembrane glutamic endopeptidase [Nitrososphaerales archaeon]